MPINLISDALLWKGRAENINEIVLQRYVQPILGMSDWCIITTTVFGPNLHSVPFIQLLLLLAALRLSLLLTPSRGLAYVVSSVTRRSLGSGELNITRPSYTQGNISI